MYTHLKWLCFLCFHRLYNSLSGLIVQHHTLMLYQEQSSALPFTPPGLELYGLFGMEVRNTNDDASGIRGRCRSSSSSNIESNVCFIEREREGKGEKECIHCSPYNLSRKILWIYKLLVQFAKFSFSLMFFGVF